MTMPPQSTRKTDGGRIKGYAQIPNCVQVRLIWQLAGGKYVVNVLHANVPVGFTPTQAVANAFMTQMLTAFTGAGNLGPQLATTTQFAGVDLRDIRGAQPGVLVPSNVAGALGTAVGNPMPNEVALVISEHTILAGRAYRGRIYIPGYAVTEDTTTAAPSAAAIAGTLAFGNSLLTNMPTNIGILCIANPGRAAYTGVVGTAHSARSATVTNVQSVTVTGQWDSQRRRGKAA